MYVGYAPDGRVLTIGRDAGPDLAAHPGALVATLLGAEDQRVALTAAQRQDAAEGFRAAIERRAGATARDDLAALDAGVIAALRALTAAQLAAAEAEQGLVAAAQAVMDRYAQADVDAGKQFGDRGQVWWDGTSFQVRERPVDPAEEQRKADVAAVVTKARENPDFALLARLLGVDASDDAAVAAAFAARRIG